MKNNRNYKDPDVRLVYERMIDTLFYSKPIENLNAIFHEDFLGYGRESSGFLLNFKDLKETIHIHTNRLRKHPLEITRKPISEKFLHHGLVYLILEEFQVFDRDNDSRYNSRISTILERIGEKWLVTYFHENTSGPNNSEAYLQMEALTGKYPELEKKIKELGRELEIEAALERVREKAMSMHHSEELKEVVKVVFDNLTDLGVVIREGAVSILVFEKGSKDHIQWIVSAEQVFPAPFKIEYSNHSLVADIINGWENGSPGYQKIYPYEEKRAFFEYLFENNAGYNALPLELKTLLLESREYGNSVSFGSNSALLIATNIGELLSQSQFDILKRFTRVFEQAYTRFLDLQKAEEQARESNIETALERVRSQTMAMHKSEDLLKIITVVSQQLEHLNFKFNTVSFAVNNQVHDYKFWFAIPGDPNPVYIQVPYIQNPMFDRMKKVFAEGREFYTDTLTPEESRAWHEHVFAHSHIPAMTEETKAYILRSGYARSIAIMPRIMLILSNYAGKPYSEDENEIIKRFAGVFEQSYTRFLDLQKAESQAREAEIEASLERVRAKAMAMHSSKDIESATAVVFNELCRLGIDMERCGITLLNETPIAELWSTPLSQESKEVVNVVTGYLDFGIHPMLQQSYQDWREKKDFTIYKLVGDEVKKYYAILEKQPEYKFPKVANYPEQQILNTFYFKEGGIFAFTIDELPAESKDIIQKFTKVFAQTYTRFLDIQKAEAQAREAQIEAALERVRSSAMAMQTSDDLDMLIGKVFTECTKLDIELDRGIIMIFNPQSLDSTWWMANPEAPNLPRCFYLQYHEHPPYLAIIQAWEERRKKWIYELKGAIKKNWDDFIFKQTELAQLPNEVKKTMMGFQKVFLNCSFNNFGCLTLATIEPMTESNFQILLRFAKVFDLTYTRFNDLKLAEAQAREAKIETALERIRAKALAMHQSNEFMEVALTLREQMGLLGQKELEASVIQFYDLKKQTILSWHVLNTPGTEGGDFSAGSFEMRKDTCRLTQQYFTAFQSENTEYSIVVEGEVLWEWLEYLSSISPEINQSLQNLEAKPDKAYYYFSKFSEGALLMVTSVPATEESRYLQRRAAQVFELAYKRYKDLKQAEKLAKKAEQDFILLKKEKKKTDEALRELTATQAQLIHSEKMASLGQLTAGIAHEIQNPLNFVNNFSELSAELIEEIEEERARKVEERDEVLVSEILGDIKENIQKINHHGKRADSIVKGMLEHSRTTTGEKALTDINTLADEYLRLSYHGMRAKDKNFQADFKTHFDTNLPKVNVLPQDLGRVLLNIVNNAFQACGTSDLRFQKPDFKPLVTVSTYKIGDQLEISISDNGPGIPEEIKHKIFQPFFTTKPTGQGTGLGLSLSYDIIKAHGGELKVETQTGKGSIFKIQIPINN